MNSEFVDVERVWLLEKKVVGMVQLKKNRSPEEAQERHVSMRRRLRFWMKNECTAEGSRVL